MIVFRFIHLVCIKSSFSLLLRSIPLFDMPRLFIHLLMDISVFSFCLLQIKLLWMCTSLYVGIYFLIGVEWLDSTVGMYLFEKLSELLDKAIVPSRISTSSNCKLLFPASSPALGMVSPSRFSILIGVWWHLIMILICTFLMTNDQHLFMWWFAISIIFWIMCVTDSRTRYLLIV